MIEQETEIVNRLGLHARAAAKLVQLSAKFQSKIVLLRPDGKAGGEADARSILSLLFLSAAFGSTVKVRADGVDEDEAVNSICDYLAG
jgi:phosphocarrier protein